MQALREFVKVDQQEGVEVHEVKGEGRLAEQHDRLPREYRCDRILSCEPEQDHAEQRKQKCSVHDDIRHDGRGDSEVSSQRNDTKQGKNSSLRHLEVQSSVQPSQQNAC